MTRGGNRPLDQGRISRRQEFREPRRRLLVVCGGKETEPAYINGLKRRLRNPAVLVDVMALGRSPSQVVKYGIKQVNRTPDACDELWCVLDVDQFADLDRAAALTRRGRIPAKLVVSNPCFELWLLLHFRDLREPIDRYTDVKPLLCRHVPDYEKNALRFSAYWPLIGDAVDRAQQLDPAGTAAAANPSTNMWLLVEAVGWKRDAAN